MTRPFDPDLPASWQGAIALPDWALIQADGPDAATFLHAQLSQDVLHLPEGEWRLGAFCSPKGRMLATVYLLRRSPQTIWLLCDASVKDALLKRLSMFVLRAKVSLHAPQDLWILGVAGAALREHAPFAACQEPMRVFDLDEARVLRLADALEVPRWLWVGPQAQAQALLGELPALSPTVWSWLDLITGVARVDAANSDAFVPQMLNFEKVGGVNFRKGCYPGQEVVARSEYRGAVKRRLAILHSFEALHPGDEVFGGDDGSQAVGRVVRSAATPGQDGQPRGHDWSAQVEVQCTAWGADLHLGSPSGALLQWGRLPYDLGITPGTGLADSISAQASNP